jgi:hypothetical protein
LFRIGNIPVSQWGSKQTALFRATYKRYGFSSTAVFWIRIGYMRIRIGYVRIRILVKFEPNFLEDKQAQFYFF